MNIVYNDRYELKVELSKVYMPDNLYHLSLERISSEKRYANTKSEYFMNKDQLKQLVEYVNGAYDDIK